MQSLNLRPKEAQGPRVYMCVCIRVLISLTRFLGRNVNREWWKCAHTVCHAIRGHPVCTYARTHIIRHRTMGLALFPRDDLVDFSLSGRKFLFLPETFYTHSMTEREKFARGKLTRWASAADRHPHGRFVKMTINVQQNVVQDALLRMSFPFLSYFSISTKSRRMCILRQTFPYATNVQDTFWDVPEISPGISGTPPECILWTFMSYELMPTNICR